MSHELSPLIAFVNPRITRVNVGKGLLDRLFLVNVKGARPRAWKVHNIPVKLPLRHNDKESHSQ